MGVVEPGVFPGKGRGELPKHDLEGLTRRLKHDRIERFGQPGCACAPSAASKRPVVGRLRSQTAQEADFFAR